ncbi:MAG: STAS domain-containing protein [Ruminiclostridium sp.]|nr:STAS domain-containing protein [Ruminiclostridium sp.]
MDKIPILKIKDTLVVLLQDDLTDSIAIHFQEDLLKKIFASKVKGVLIDISLLGIVDSFLGRVISDTAKMIKLLGAELVLVGMSSSVAITLVELGLEIGNVSTSLDIDSGLELLTALVKSNAVKEVDNIQITEEGKNDFI